MMTEATLQKVLAGYAGNGWKLFPCREKALVNDKTGKEIRGAKTPLAQWKQEATSDPSQIGRWIRKFPGCMWAVATGTASGFFAVDLDKGHGDAGTDGIKAFQDFCRERGLALPATLTQRTAGGGIHMLFRMPEGKAIGNATAILPGVDVRGNGGYIIVAPSLNQDTGTAYEWVDATCPIAEPPLWLVELVLSKGKPTTTAAQNAAQAGAQAAYSGQGTPYGLKALQDEVAGLRNADQGTRNDTLNRAAVKLFALAAGGELDADAVTRELEAAALSIGLNAGETQATLASARKAGYASPRTAPARGMQGVSQWPAAAEEWETPLAFSSHELPELDTAKLPPFMGRYVDGMAEALQVPKELVFGMCLACISTASQWRYCVQIRGSWSEPLNVYVLCPLEPGNRKSAAVAAVSSPLRFWEARQREALEPVIKSVVSQRNTLEKAISYKRDKAAKADDAERQALQAEIEEMEQSLPKIPRVPRLLADNITPEALAALMAEMKECISILTAEGGIFDILAGMYTKTPNLDLFLKAHTGNEAFRVDRKLAPPIILENPLLTLGISPQPVTLSKRSASEIFRARGLDARFLYFLPKSILGQRKIEPEEIDPAVKEEWRNFLLSLLPAEWSEEPEDKKPLCLDQAAYEEHAAFRAAVEKELAEGGEFSSMTDWGSKLPGAVARIAGLFHLATVATPEERNIAIQTGESCDPAKYQITAETMRQAIYVGSFLTEHAKAAYALMGTDETLEGAKKVLSWLRRTASTTFTTQACWQATRGTFHHMEPLREALRELEERYFIREIPGTASATAGRKAAPSYMVNPLALKG